MALHDSGRPAVGGFGEVSAAHAFQFTHVKWRLSQLRLFLLRCVVERLPGRSRQPIPVVIEVLHEDGVAECQPTSAINLP